MVDPRVDFTLVEFRTAFLVRYQHADDERIRQHVQHTQRYYKEEEGREDWWVNWNRLPNIEDATAEAMRQGPNHISFIALMIYAAHERGFETVDARAWYKNISQMLGADINNATVLRAVLDTELYLEAEPEVMGALVRLGLDMSRTRISDVNGLHYLVGNVLYAALFHQENTVREEEAYARLAYELLLWDYRKFHTSAPTDVYDLLEDHAEEMTDEHVSEDGVDMYTRAVQVAVKAWRMRRRTVYRQSALTDFSMIVSPVGERAVRYLELPSHLVPFSREECIATVVAYTQPPRAVDRHLNKMLEEVNFHDLPSFDTEESRALQALTTFVRVLLLNVRQRYRGHDSELRDLIRFLDQSGICPYNDDEPQSPLARALFENRRFLQEFPKTARWVIRNDHYMTHAAQILVARAGGPEVQDHVLVVPVAYWIIVTYLLARGDQFRSQGDLELAAMLWRRVPAVQWDALEESIREVDIDVDRELYPKRYRKIHKRFTRQRDRFQKVQDLLRDLTEEMDYGAGRMRTVATE